VNGARVTGPASRRRRDRKRRRHAARARANDDDDVCEHERRTRWGNKRWRTRKEWWCTRWTRRGWARETIDDNDDDDVAWRWERRIHHGTRAKA